MEHRRKSERREFRNRVITYIVMTLSVVVLATFAILYVAGYRFDFGARSVEQSGMVQFASKPIEATVEVDGKTLSTKTPTKSDVLPGDHSFVMWREGYETWFKALNIKAGTLTWLNYARLIPKQRPVEAVDSLPGVTATLAAPGGKAYATLTTGDEVSIRFYDISKDKIAESKTASLVDSGSPGASFGLVGWDPSGRYLLVSQKSADGKIEWLVVDRIDLDVGNITRSMGVAFQKVVFADDSGAKFYGLAEGNVRSVDTAAGILSRPMVSGVVDFWYNKEQKIISYLESAQAETGYRTVGIVRPGGKPVNIHRTDTDTNVPLSIRAARYFGVNYVAILEGQTITLLSGKLPEVENDSMTHVYQMKVDNVVTSYEFSPSGRFLFVQQGDKYQSYDIERGSLSALNTLPGDGEARQIRWLDDFMIWSDRGGNLAFAEFDGANIHKNINSVASGFDVALSPNGRYLYSVGQSEGGLQLQRIRMILEN